MATLSRREILSLAITAACAGSAAARAQEPIPPGLVLAGKTRERTDRMMNEDPLKPARPEPEWKKAQADADKLLELAQAIHDQVKTSQQKIPAGLAAELKQIEKLSKKLRQDLLL